MIHSTPIPAEESSTIVSQSSAAAYQQSPLLRLPAELRNIIYRRAIEKATFRFCWSTKDASQPWSSAGPRFIRNAPNLPLTCQQVYHESKPYVRKVHILCLETRCNPNLHPEKEFSEYIAKLDDLKYDLSAVTEIEVDFPFLASMEAYYEHGDRGDGVFDRARALFPALETVALPRWWCVDYKTAAATRGCFNKPNLRITSYRGF